MENKQETPSFGDHIHTSAINQYSQGSNLKTLKLNLSKLGLENALNDSPYRSLDNTHLSTIAPDPSSTALQYPSPTQEQLEDTLNALASQFTDALQHLPECKEQVQRITGEMEQLCRWLIKDNWDEKEMLRVQEAELFKFKGVVEGLNEQLESLKSEKQRDRRYIEELEEEVDRLINEVKIHQDGEDALLSSLDKKPILVNRMKRSTLTFGQLPISTFGKNQKQPQSKQFSESLDSLSDDDDYDAFERDSFTNICADKIQQQFKFQRQSSLNQNLPPLQKQLEQPHRLNSSRTCKLERKKSLKSEIQDLEQREVQLLLQISNLEEQNERLEKANKILQVQIKRKGENLELIEEKLKNERRQYKLDEDKWKADLNQYRMHIYQLRSGFKQGGFQTLLTLNDNRSPNHEGITPKSFINQKFNPCRTPISSSDFGMGGPQPLSIGSVIDESQDYQPISPMMNNSRVNSPARCVDGKFFGINCPVMISHKAIDETSRDEENQSRERGIPVIAISNLDSNRSLKKGVLQDDGDRYLLKPTQRSTNPTLFNSSELSDSLKFSPEEQNKEEQSHIEAGQFQRNSLQITSKDQRQVHKRHNSTQVKLITNNLISEQPSQQSDSPQSCCHFSPSSDSQQRGTIIQQLQISHISQLLKQLKVCPRNDPQQIFSEVACEKVAFVELANYIENREQNRLVSENINIQSPQQENPEINRKPIRRKRIDTSLYKYGNLYDGVAVNISSRKNEACKIF
ncbi:hypothetical protein FGO68_gene10098 [Halteria grandinella]|uniref:Uncharacterized protein n=1 Tax=Halteria grandinella TaxID=5974 RepID=A0A8J8NYJ1_HALGN|nr:hypothetical protein FGO68_gene10098 [Halteria grandinella]